MYNITTPYIALPQFYTTSHNFVPFMSHVISFSNNMDRWYCNGLYGINSPTYKLQLTAVQEHIYCNSGLNVRPENIVITACTNVRTHTQTSNFSLSIHVVPN